MDRKKIGVWGIILLVLVLAGWRIAVPDFATRLQQKYGIAANQNVASASSDGITLTQKTLISDSASLAVAEDVSEADSGEAASQWQTPSRENGWVVSNTRTDLEKLIRSQSAILLRNARIETSDSTPLPIPANLRAQGDPGCYIVQARDGITPEFYENLERIGAHVISYIPNNAALVSMSSEQAEACSDVAENVLPYHPYYKLDRELLEVALGENQEPYRAGTLVRVAIAPGHEESFCAKVKSAGLTLLSRADTQFGEVALLQPSREQVVELAQSADVHLMGVFRPRAMANDLTMIRLGIATNAANTENYLGLSGSNIFLNVNDTMVDTNHPALKGRVQLAQGTNGRPILPPNPEEMAHGTHVMGTILGDGAESSSVSNRASGSYLGADLLYKGAATNAVALYLPFDPESRSVGADLDMIRWAAETNYVEKKRTNVLVSNNSWNFSRTPAYDLSAAEFDRAVRDALPGVTGSQPVLFVFSAGNEGGGDFVGRSGIMDTILSPATAKNVITVGALESTRRVMVAHTNEVYATNEVGGQMVITTNFVVVTNSTLYAASDSEQQVAYYSSRGNVGVGIEGPVGRIKPDVVAPGSFIVSTRGESATQPEFDTYEETMSLPDQLLEARNTNNYALFAPTNIVSIKIECFPNRKTTQPMPDLSIFLRKGKTPDSGNFVGYNSFTTNFVMDVNPGDDGEDASWSTGFGDWYYAIRCEQDVDVEFDLLVTFSMLNSDEEREYAVDLESACTSLGDYYRYESGTSMAAAAISGMTVLVQEFFEHYAPAGVTTPSPALLKALIINGANPVANHYSRKESYGINYQGWGIPNMTNVIPSGLTNKFSEGTWPMWFIDQSATNALATGESWEKAITVPTNLHGGNMKVTLVWTDPAGNPSAGIKLVNNLDLVVSNAQTRTVYVGNDFKVNTDYNQGYIFSSSTNTPTTNGVSTNLLATLEKLDQARDIVNNVESVIIKGPLATNYVISVQARRVNVNALPAHTNGIVQDFALIVSFQGYTTEFNSTNKFEVETPDGNEGVMGTNLWYAPIDYPTNSQAMVKQRVGASSPLQGVDGILTNGVPSQWHFYVFTNFWWGPTTYETNNPGSEEEIIITNRMRLGGQYIAFSTFAVPDLSIDERLNRADIDMYVSTNSALTNLDATVINEAVEMGWVSRNPGGSELFTMTNSVENQVFYIGIKCEDQKAAEYNFVGITSPEPFGQDNNGVRVVRFNPGNVWVPDGSPDEPGGTEMYAIVTTPIVVGTIAVSNYYEAQNAGDLLISLRNEMEINSQSVALHNHSFLEDDLNPVRTNGVTVIYDDVGTLSGNRRRTDGPGTLLDFYGWDGYGQWTMTLTDNALNHTNRVWSTLYMTPYRNQGSSSVQPYAYDYHFFDVEDDVTAVVITVEEIYPQYGLELYIYKDGLPTREIFDYAFLIPSNGREVTISREDIPALETGRYYAAIYNPNPVILTYTWNVDFIRGFLIGDDQGVPSVNTPLPLLDDAYTISYTNTKPVVVAEGDDEGDDTSTNTVYDSVITISDDRVVDGVNVGIRLDHPRISDLSISLVSPQGTSVLLSENRGWDATNAAPNEVELIPNEKNNSVYGSGAAAKGSEYTYAFFSNDTNYSLLPIKFAMPPYTNSGRGLVLLNSSFEDSEVGCYITEGDLISSDDFRWELSGSTNTSVAWDEEKETTITNLTVVTNFRTWVWADTNEAYTGTNFLIANRTVLRTEFTGLPADTNYYLRIPFKRPEPMSGLVTWWRANNDYLDNEWNLPLQVAEGSSWVGFDTNGLEGYAFGFTNGCLVARSPNVLDEIGTNFTVEGWFKVDPAIVENVSSDLNMPLFEFTQVFTNYFTNTIITPEGEEEEIIYESTYRERGLSAWLMRWRWVDGRQVYLPLGSLYLELGPSATTGETVAVSANLVEPGGSPSVEDYLDVYRDWVHVAISFESGEDVDTLRIYANGQLAAEQSWDHGYVEPRTALNFNLGYGTKLGYRVGTLSPIYYPGYFTGLLDEFSWFSRPLDESEIQEIVDAGPRGKAGVSHPPLSVPVGAKVTLREVGSTTNLFQAMLPDISTEWQVGKARFHTLAVTNQVDSEGNPVEVKDPVYEVLIDVQKGGVAFDEIAVTTRGLAYMPEVPLSELDGEPSKGDWRLLVWDTRAGATNPTPALLSWTLDLGYQPTNAAVIDLNSTNDYTHAGTIGTNETVYFRVSVPQDAVVATNTLSASTNLILVGRWDGVPKFDRGTDDYFWAYIPPDPMDYLITTNVSSQAPLVPGGRYYLALRNPMAQTEPGSYKIAVTFGETYSDIPEGVITLTNKVPYIVDPEKGGGKTPVDYYHFNVSTNAIGASFLVYDATTNVTMVVKKGLPLPTDANYDYVRATGTSGFGEVTVYTNSAPVPLTSGNWFIGIYNRGYSETEPFEPVAYKVVVTEYTNNMPEPEPLFSGRPVSGILEPGEVRYYSYLVSPVGISLWSEVDQLDGGDVTVYNKYGLPLPDEVNAFYTYDVQAPGDSWYLTKDEEVYKYPLHEGTWYYAIANSNSVPVSYRFRVTEFSIDPDSIIWLENGIAVTNSVGLIPDGTNCVYYGFDVTDNGVGSLYEVFDRQNGNVNLYIQPGTLPNPFTYEFAWMAEEGATNSYARLSAWTQDLTPGYWFFTAQNSEVAEDLTQPLTNVVYQIRATEYPAPQEDAIVNLANNVPVHVSNEPMYAESYYRYTTSDNPLYLAFTVTNATDSVSVYLLDESPVYGPRPAALQFTTVWDALIELDQTNSYIPLVPGDWYLVVENASRFDAVGYDVWASEVGGSEPEQTIDIGFEYDPETGLLTLVWASEVGSTYAVRGTENALAKPVVWETIAEVTATEKVTRYTLTQELMEKYTFFSVKLVATPPGPDPENIKTFVGYDSDTQELSLQWNAVPKGIYFTEGKAVVTDPEWIITGTMTNETDYNVLMTCRTPVDVYPVARVTPIGGVTPATIHTSAEYSAVSNELILHWNSTAGLKYTVQGWTNLMDKEALAYASVTADSESSSYRVKLAEAGDCNYFSIIAGTPHEELDLAIGFDPITREIILTWNSIIGNSYRVEGLKMGTMSWEQIDTIKAIEVSSECRVSIDVGYTMFRVIALGQIEDPTVPEDYPLDLKISLNPEDSSQILITVDARDGDVFEVEYCSDLSEEVWSISGKPYQATENGPMVITVPLEEVSAKFFRFIRKG